MKHYKIAFVGLGSIATRHLKNVAAFLNNIGDTYSIDLYRSQMRPLPEELQSSISEFYLYADEIPADRQYDVVFVTNPTSMHYETLEKFCKNTKSFFIEKPVFDNTNVDEKIFKHLEGVTCYVACPLRYNPTLQYLKENIIRQDVISARAISSSYLPDWRPGQDYRETYSAHRKMGGGVGIDLIHEWDYLIWLFGFPQKCQSIQSKISDLEIDSDDIAIYIAMIGKTAIELHLDYFGRKNIRKLELFTKYDTIICDIINGLIKYERTGRIIELRAERDTIQTEEIKHFFEIINNKLNNDSTLEHAYCVLKIAKGEY